MSYNILKKNVKFSGPVSGTIEGMVDTSTNQPISGSKDFLNITGSNAKFLNQINAQSASFDGTVVLNNDVTVAANKRIYFDGTGIFSNQGPYIYGNASTMYVDGDDNLYLYHDTRMSIFHGSNRIVDINGGAIGVDTTISSSNHISASAFVGDGSQLTLITASFITASNIQGLITADKIQKAPGLSTSGGSLAIDLATNGGIAQDSGLKIELKDLSGFSSTFNNNQIMVISGSGIGNRSVTLGYLGDNLLVNASNIDGGTLNNARLPQTIDRQVISASVGISGSSFQGDGSGLTNLTTSPAGANTQVQFNDGGTQAGNSAFTFSKTTGLMTVTTGSFSKISSSLIPNANNSHALGDADNGLRWSNVASVGGQFTGLVTITTGAINHRLGIGTLAPTNELEVTGNAVIIGELSASAGITGSAFHGSGKTLTGVPFTSTPSTSNIVFVQDGGAQTLNTSDSLQWTGTVLKTSNLSASVNVSASALHTMNGITAPGAGGSDLVFLDSNGNVTAGGITMISDGSLTLNFNDNQISGSGHVSASAFFGDGSNLQNVQATPQFRFYTYLGYANVNTGNQWIYSRTNQTATANPASSIFLKWIAPGSGSLVRWVITPGTTTSNAQNSGLVRTSFLKNNITQNATTLARTAHVTGAFDITRTVNGTAVKAAVVDWTGTNLTVSGSNSFDPGDTLLFGISAENAKDDCIISIVFKIDESITYP